MTYSRQVRKPALAVLALVLPALAQLADALAGGSLVDHPAMLLLAAVAGYAAGLYAPIPAVAAGAVLAAGALTGANHLHQPGEYPVLDDLVFYLLVTGAPALAGAAVRVRARQVAESRRLGALLAEQRDAELRTARLVERNGLEVRLHRDFSHRTGAIVMRAEGALGASCGKQRSALADIEAAARATLDELREAIGTLRPTQASPGDPVPSVGGRQPAQLPRVPASRSGLGVDPRGLAVASGCGVLLAVEAVVSPESTGPAWANAVVGFAAAVPLAWHRTHPVLSAVGTLTVLMAMTRWLTSGWAMVTAILVLLVASYSVGAHAVGWRRVVGVAAIAAGAVMTFLTPRDADRSDGDLLAVLTCVALAAAAGVVTAGWIDRAAQQQDALAELERGREVERELARAEQRSEIARDLHDTIAQAMTVICLQSSGAQVATADRDTVLRTVLTTARQAFVELRQGLNRLGSPAALDVEELAAQARRVGLRPEVEVTGPVHELEAPVRALAARLVREALANAGRYAPGSRVVVVIRSGARLVVEITDDGAGDADWGYGAGTGLRGLSEEVDRAGGGLVWGERLGGGFRVAADLPTALVVAR